MPAKIPAITRNTTPITGSSGSFVFEMNVGCLGVLQSGSNKLDLTTLLDQSVFFGEFEIEVHPLPH